MGNHPPVGVSQAEIEVSKERQRKEKDVQSRIEALSKNALQVEEKLSQARLNILNMKNPLTTMGTVVIGGVVLSLAVDLVSKRHAPLIKLRMKRELRSESKRSSALPCGIAKLPHDESRRLALGTAMCASLPVALVGPSGCGKSELLQQVRDTYSTAASSIVRPVKMISLCANENKRDSTNDRRMYSDYIDAANQILKALKVPAEPPLLFELIRHLFGRGTFTMEERAEMATDRLLLALDLLFECMAEINAELRGRAPSPSVDTRGLIIFDEVQDLDRFASAGGSDVFNRIATLSTRYAVDRKAVRVLFAGSSADLCIALNQTLLKSGRRIDTYLEDYPQHAAVNWLVDSHRVSKSDAQRFTDAVGTRLRLLEHLINNTGDKPVHKVIDDMLSSKRLETAAMMRDERLRKVFDDLALGKYVSIADLPKDLRDPLKISSVFYLRGDEGFFQDKIVESIWKKI